MTPPRAFAGRRAAQATQSPRLRPAARLLARGLALGAALVVTLLASPRVPAAVPEADAPTRTLKVPWARPSSKHAVLAALNGGRIQVLDLGPLYDELLKRPTPRRPQRLDLRLPDVWMRFYPITNEVYCVQFRPREGAGESWAETRLPGSAWRRARTRYPAERYSFFFWVADDSFETFRTLRDALRRERADVDWKPVRSGAPLEICQGMGGGPGLDPQ